MKKRPWNIYNEDGVGTLEASLDDPVGSLREWVDRVLDNIKLDAFAVSLATPDLVKYKSEVGQIKWSRFWEGKDEIVKDFKFWQKQGIAIYKRIFELGTDPLEIYAGRVHEHGIPFIAEVRMGDTHHQKIDPDFPGCSQFLVDHPQWVIRRDDPLPAGAVETAMDYSYAGVREHRLAIIKELVNKPQVDGLELNCNRHLKYFNIEEAPYKLDILTDYVRQVRGFLDEVGKDRRLTERMPLGVRIPPTLEECRLVGLDLVSWLRQGYLDYVILGDFEHNDPQIPVEEFVSAAKGTDCSVLIQMADTIGGLWHGQPSMKDRGRGTAIYRDCYNGLLNTDAEARATAYNAYAWGADGIGFWNICQTPER